MNTYLKINWAAIVELLMIRFVRWVYQSLRCFGPVINGMYATHNPLQEIRRWSAIRITTWKKKLNEYSQKPFDRY